MKGSSSQRVVVLLFALVAGACGSTEERGDVELDFEQLLLTVPDEAREPIEAAEAKLGEARTTLERVQSEAEALEQLRVEAMAQVDQLEQHAAEARAELQAATGGANEAVRALRAAWVEADATLRDAARHARYVDGLVALGAELVALRAGDVATAEAQLELAEARAVAALDAVPAEAVELAQLEAKLRRAENDRSALATRLRAVRRKLEIEREHLVRTTGGDGGVPPPNELLSLPASRADGTRE